MKSISAKSDIGIDQFGNLIIAKGIEAVAQRCEQRLKFFLNESELFYNQGVPYFQEVFNNLRFQGFVAAVVTRALQTVEGVDQVLRVETTRVSGRVHNISATVKSQFGTVTVESGIG